MKNRTFEEKQGMVILLLIFGLNSINSYKLKKFMKIQILINVLYAKKSFKKHHF